jgi:nicotinate-nucleotide adenylyltransferase
MAGRRVGVFGGTFDPPHIGHLVIAVDVRESLRLDLVLMVVANVPWQKAGSRVISPAPDRMDMVRAAVAGLDGVEASDLEIRRGGSSYSVDTLTELRLAAPEDELFLILGSDAASLLHTWERAEDLPGLCRIVVVERPGAATTVPAGFAVDRVDVPQLEVSSTDLRERAASGRSLRFLMPDGVISVLRDRRLYGDRP